ncbi:MAG: DUF4040 domain-containing protein [Planctomycetota bacterium]
MIDVLILTLLAGTAVVIVRMRGLLAAALLTGIYSFLGACWMVILDAPDVAFTEAAVGAGIATVLMLATLSLTSTKAKGPTRSTLVPLLVVIVTGAALLYGTFDMPHYGDPEAPPHKWPDPSYVERTRVEVDMPNVVTAVLASYRGYDTLGETTVIFTAVIGVMLMLRRPRREEEEEGGAG